jgi:hypothetical protein
MLDFKLYSLSEDEAHFLAQLVETFVTGKPPAARVDTALVSLTILARLRTPAEAVAPAAYPDAVALAAQRLLRWTPLLEGTVYDADETHAGEPAQRYGRIHIEHGGERLAFEHFEQRIFIDLPKAYRLCEGGTLAQNEAARQSRLFRSLQNAPAPDADAEFVEGDE